MSTLWYPAKLSDTTTNDSDKTITVTSNTVLRVYSIRVEYTTNATAGTRQLEIEIQDSSSDILAQYQPAITQVESNTYYYQFSPTAPDLLTLRDSSHLRTPIDPLELPGGYKIRIRDNNAVDATGTGETMIIHILGVQRRL